MMEKKYKFKMLFLLALVTLATLILLADSTMADDHKERDFDSERYESREKDYESRERDRRHLDNENEGNEITGLTTAWLLVVANVSVLLSLLSKGLIRYANFESTAKDSLKKWNRTQKKHLMRFHYILNPVALIMGTIHFLLSSCRRTPFPEWGLVCIVLMVFLGASVKFGWAPKTLRRGIYRLHTHPAAISVIIVLLVSGHMIMD